MDFNYRAAAWVYDEIMKMDDDSAFVFSRNLVHDVLMEDIENNRRTINSRVQQINKRLANGLGRSVVAKSTATDYQLVSAAVVGLVSKADDYYNVRDEKGRFSTVERRIRTAGPGAKPVNRRAEQRLGIPSPAKVGLSGNARAQYQSQYLGLADAMDQFTRSGYRDVRAVIENKQTGHREEVKAKEVRAGKGEVYDPKKHNIVAVRASAGSEGQAGSFNLVSALGGSSAAAGRTSRGVRGVEQGGSAFEQEWNRSEDIDASTNAGTYRRIGAGAKFLGQVAPGSPKAQIASGVGQFVGQYGPEAEKVIGPHMRRGTYRYRGTERTPESALIEARNYEVRAAEKTSGQLTEVERQDGSIRSSVNFLQEKVPSARLAEIQLKSGKVPPSEGVIIDRDGKIVTQAIGYADDHYLPFNLKNLKGLQGGHYVRTRTSGGPTTEDIYTGLMSGARSLTVVSNSGIFTVTFDDEFRGTRRYNDKANQMIGRYGKTLDAIKGGKIEREKLSPEVRAQIREEVEREMDPEDFTQAEIAEAINDKIKEYREVPSLTRAEVANIEEQAKKRSDGSEQGYKRARAALLDNAMQSKASRFYQLDGEGYATSLEALQEQFPYYIADVSYMHRKGAKVGGERTDPNRPPERLLRFKQGDDKGYVKPRYNRPGQAQEGYYDETITGRGKISADRTNYQNWPNNPERAMAGKLRAQPSPTDETEETAATPGTNKKREMQDKIAAARRVEASKTALRQAVEFWADRVELGDADKTIKEAKVDFDAVYASANKRNQLDTEVQSIYNRMKTGNKEQQAVAEAAGPIMRAYDLSNAMIAGTPYTQEAATKRTKVPFTFPEKQYKPSATEAEQQHEYDRQAKKVQKAIRDFNPSAAQSQQELGELAVHVANLGHALAAGDDNEAINAIALIPGMSEERQTAVLRHGKAEQFTEAAEALQRMRTLKVNMEGREKKPEPEAKTEVVTETARTETAAGAITTGSKSPAEFLRAVFERNKDGEWASTDMKNALKAAAESQEDHDSLDDAEEAGLEFLNSPEDIRAFKNTIRGARDL